MKSLSLEEDRTICEEGGYMMEDVSTSAGTTPEFTDPDAAKECMCRHPKWEHVLGWRECARERCQCCKFVGAYD